jgi:hypothetical protein
VQTNNSHEEEDRKNIRSSAPVMPPNNSLQLTRLACGKLERDLPAELHENG